MKRAPARLFRKEYLAHGEWVPDCELTLAEFIKDNAHDEWVLEEFVPKLSKLRVGQSWTYNGGAAGVDRFTRVRSRRRKRK